MEQKVIITKSDSDINFMLDKGWRIVSVTAQHVSSSGGGYSSLEGKFCFVIERGIEEK